MRTLPLVLLLLVPGAAHAQHLYGGELTSLGIDDAELTPDGRFAVTRELAAQTRAHVWDMATGALVASYLAAPGPVGNACCDAVAVTNTRAVMLGTTIQVLDLAVPGTARIAEIASDPSPRDLEIDPLGRFAVVRAGSAGLVIDLATGAVVLSSPSTTILPGGPYDVDSAVATADHGVVTDWNQLTTSGVTVFELAPPAGGPPRVVYQSPPNERLQGRPHDIATSPDGQWCGVRSDREVALYRLDGTNTRLVWKQFPAQPVAPFDDSAMDSILLTDTWLFTLGRSASPIGNTVIEAYDHAGGRIAGTVQGDPHDIDISPNGERVVYRTSQRLGMIPVSTVQLSGPFFLLEVDVASVLTGFGAGLDSIAASNTHVAAMFVRAGGPIGRLYRIDGAFPVFEATFPLTSGPLDVGFTPDGTRAVFVSRNSVRVYDVRTKTTTLSEQIVAGPGWWPWCDGVVVQDGQAVAFGIGAFNSGEGWTAPLDLFDEPARYCRSAPNSTGNYGELVATGSSRPAANDLTLWASGLPAGVVTLLTYGSPGTPVRFGDGALCLAGPVVGRFLTTPVTANGTLQVDLDQNGVSTGPGTFLVGTTWLFQLVHRDPGALSGFNATNGVRVPF